ncbi:MAG: aminodeoxychorismate synthase component I [Candidatus Hydrogenedens sp.]|nr:aminodeoxychorismate synthase component I [Candidatus Hydrogenedens sp.]
MRLPPGSACLPRGNRAEVFRDPVEIVQARTMDEVVSALSRVAQWVESGLTAVGYVSYEAAPAFDPALRAHVPSPALLPLVWFALYAGSAEDSVPEPRAQSVLDWQPNCGEETYREALDRIQEYIAAGDTYQVNYTLALQAVYDGDAQELFWQGYRAQPVPHAAYLDMGGAQVLSLSPELFFSLDGTRIVSRPMKGTRARGRFAAEDDEAREVLLHSAKDRAENVMIVDMIRNDLGRIARGGSVRVEALCEAERYRTVWQMTSTVAAETDASVPEIFRAMFPCASVTGAPKVRTMAIIRELESEPRGVYCGAVGVWRPGRRAEFNVAIRTMTMQDGCVSYGVGSGVTADSTPEGEWHECLLKAAAVGQASAPFDLLETLLLCDGEYARLERHLTRMAASADYFGIPFCVQEARRLLHEAQAPGAWRLRLLWSEAGKGRAERHPLSPTPERLRLAVAEHAVDERDPFLFHKTTRRAMYHEALAAHPDADDVLLWNTRGEVTESCLANVVVQLEGRRYTPPVACGLLAGCERATLLERGEISERVITLDDLRSAEAVWLINSVRGERAAELINRT